jgi:hypothetical protein
MVKPSTTVKLPTRDSSALMQSIEQIHNVSHLPHAVQSALVLLFISSGHLDDVP